MGRSGKQLLILSFFVVYVLTFSSLVKTAESKDSSTDAGKLFESKCNQCHSVERPKSKRKSKDGWQATVMRMKNKNGCPISDEEAATIINYLSENFGK